MGCTLSSHPFTDRFPLGLLVAYVYKSWFSPTTVDSKPVYTNHSLQQTPALADAFWRHTPAAVKYDQNLSGLGGPTFCPRFAQLFGTRMLNNMLSMRRLFWTQSSFLSRCQTDITVVAPSGSSVTCGWEQRGVKTECGSSNKCHASSNRCLTSSNKKLLF